MTQDHLFEPCCAVGNCTQTNTTKPTCQGGGCNQNNSTDCTCLGGGACTQYNCTNPVCPAENCPGNCNNMECGQCNYCSLGHCYVNQTMENQICTEDGLINAVCQSGECVGTRKFLIKYFFSRAKGSFQNHFLKRNSVVPPEFYVNFVVLSIWLYN